MENELEELLIKYNATIDKLNKDINEIFRLANNGVYFETKGDYLDALYCICKIVHPDINDAKIGKSYIEGDK